MLRRILKFLAQKAAPSHKSSNRRHRRKRFDESNPAIRNYLITPIRSYVAIMQVLGRKACPYQDHSRFIITSHPLRIQASTRILSARTWISQASRTVGWTWRASRWENKLTGLLTSMSYQLWISQAWASFWTLNWVMAFSWVAESFIIMIKRQLFHALRSDKASRAA